MEVIAASPAGIARAIECMRAGGVVAHATETCYGFAADLKNPPAMEVVFWLKKRPHRQPVSALFASIEEAKGYVEWNRRAEELAKKHLPGPLTLILPLRETPSPLVTALENPPTTLGVRISSHPIAMELVRQYGSPISTTSANVHGNPNAYDALEIVRQLGDDAPLLILDSGTLPQVPPSTIIDLTMPEDPPVRRGSIAIG